MTSPSRVPGWLTAIAAALLCSSGAGAAAEKPSAPNDSAAIFPGTSSKEPISIDADKLVYYDKEHKAVYSGNVVVIQGDTKMTCSAMSVFLDHAPTQGAAASNEGSGAPIYERPSGSPLRTRASSIWTLRGLSPSCRKLRSRLATAVATTRPRAKCGSLVTSR